MGENTPRNVLVGIPTMGSIHTLLVQKLLLWSRKHRDVNFYFQYMVAPVDRARNTIVKFFLEAEAKQGVRFTHLFFIDSDTIPPDDALERLLSHDLDVVSGLTPIVSYTQNGDVETHDNCFTNPDRDGDGKIVQTNIARRNTGLQEIFRCGASCILIKREVFERIPQPYYQFIVNEDNTKHVRSEDINFCDEVKKAGMKIHADTDVVCQHYKSVMI